MSIPTPEDGSITQPSGSNTNSAIDRLNSTLRVDPTQHPDWAGVMHLSDCAKARFYFNGRVAFYDPQKSMTFWSRRWTVRPPGNEFELPFGAKYICRIERAPPTETCTILVRMAKDFGKNVLPNGNGFTDESDDPPAAAFVWGDILDSLDYLENEVVESNAPAWTYGYTMEGPEAVLMVLPSSSVMSRRWAADMRAGLGDVQVGANGRFMSIE
ncbi:MAG: hypothetical protein LQ346_002714 [Caloplaca aetnensis]|nr:MAG: hypothetical protein LQ346_002714 [Caloplaca aetnensis]